MSSGIGRKRQGQQVRKVKRNFQDQIGQYDGLDLSAPKETNRKPREQNGSLTIQNWTAFGILFASHLVAAAYAPIQDCDEVFNFWEPTHYLNHGYGMQTWELSPDFAIRSWLYTALHAIPMYAVSWVPFVTHKSAEFYAMRAIFAFACALCEMRLFAVIARVMSLRIAWCFLLVVASSTGMFHASVSYLPSTFAMNTATLGAASFMDRSNKNSTAHGLTWFSIGTIVGWPFAGVLAVPFLLGEFLDSLHEGELERFLCRLSNGLVRSITVLAIEIFVDSVFYRKLVCVPLNIVRYNVFSKGGGPNIYGTEPWHFYFRNLLVNFNYWFLLACVALPFLTGYRSLAARVESRLSLLQVVTFVSPFYAWLGIFTVQPHKEERFMYPVYSFLALNAATSLHLILLFTGGSTSSSLVRRIPAKLRIAFVSFFVAVCIFLGVWRTTGLVTAYSAPLTLFSSLQYQSTIPSDIQHNVTVCVGKEWYRFTSSYHLPSNARLRFIKSGFSGLLPGAFMESKDVGLGPFAGTYLIPVGMNDKNLEDLGKHTALAECAYLIDSWFDGVVATDLEPDFLHNTVDWEVETCLPFMDASRTGLLGRVFWIPETNIIPQRYRRKWGEYCLLKRRHAKGFR